MSPSFKYDEPDAKERRWLRDTAFFVGGMLFATGLVFLAVWAVSR